MYETFYLVVVSNDENHSVSVYVVHQIEDDGEVFIDQIYSLDDLVVFYLSYHVDGLVIFYIIHIENTNKDMVFLFDMA